MAAETAGSDVFREDDRQDNIGLALEAILEESRSIVIPDKPRRVSRIADDPRPRPPGAPYAYQEAAYELLSGEEPLNLLVASPTGSGKTSVIVKAAEIAAQRGEKLVVAEPLIALVEQVHARLVASLPDITVDMRTGPSVKETEGVEASITVCTYEVLASACSSEAAISLRGCKRVAIDEFHFIGEERGPVIQEILDWCRRASATIVALSGTLVNESEVGKFISGVNGFQTVVVGAANRPIPLIFHYYDTRNPNASFSTLRVRTHWERSSGPTPDFQNIGGLRGRQDVLRLISSLQYRNLLPALLVTFSCKKLDEWAEDAVSGYSFLSRNQRSVVVRAFRDMLRSIPPEDTVLFERLERLARLGVGLHHSHLPVQYLELVSHLAEHRCLMLVFSTSTLSAGINLPVRTVCLCSARIPHKVDGEMVHEVINPLLFHQLAGRAGRPGYETVGNVVVLGCGDDGWTAAAALLEQQLPPVRPTSSFNSGDVLRAAKTGRCLALDRLVFSNSLAAKAAERAQKSKILCNRALNILDPNAELLELLRQAAEAVVILSTAQTAVLREPAALPVGLIGENGLWLINLGRGGFRVSDQAQDGAVQLTKTRGQSGTNKAIRGGVHASMFEAMCKVRDARSLLAILWRRTDTGQNFWIVASVLRNARDDIADLERDVDIDEYRSLERKLKECGFLHREGAPTVAGCAAALIRSTSKPEVLVQILMRRYEELDKNAYLRLASLTMGAGTQADEPPEDVSMYVSGEEFLRSQLVNVGGVSVPTYNRALMLWAEGASLAQIEEETGVSCGQCARHVVRANSLLCELGYARKELGLDSDPALGAASQALCRGLPFAKRGGGRVALG